MYKNYAWQCVQSHAMEVSRSLDLAADMHDLYAVTW